MQGQNIQYKYAVLILALLGALFFIPFLGNVHLFDWDEINFAEVAREMVVTKKYGEPQINFQLFTEKPPLYFWLQAICMNIFGINEFAARLPNALLGMLVLPVLFLIGRKLRDNFFGILWAGIYGCSILPHLYFKSGIIDPWFNFFIFLSLYGLINAADKAGTRQGKLKWLLFGGVMLGLALLTKGPAAVIVIGLTFLFYWMSKKFRWVIPFPRLLLYALVALATAGVWFAVNYLQHGGDFIKEFTIRQWALLTTPDAGHGGFFFYHFVVLFFGCFPATAFFIHSLVKKDQEDEQMDDYKKWMKIFFWVVLITFTLVKTKIVHYSSLCYYPISFLATVSIYNIIKGKRKFDSWVKILVLVSAIPFLIAPFALTYFGLNIEKLKPLLSKDPFAAENIHAQVHWTGWEILPALVLVISLGAAFYYYKKQRLTRAVLILFGSSAIFIQLCLFFFIGRIEAYSQRANISFWQAHASEDCYMMSYEYKTYTFYFYGEQRPQANSNYTNNEWLTKGPVDKTVYISCKPGNKAQLEKEVTDAVFLYTQNGFYFYKRSPQAVR